MVIKMKHDLFSEHYTKMSIHGGQPIPCWYNSQCDRAWEGKNYCDLSLQQCTREPGNAPVSSPVNVSSLDNVSNDTNWLQAADKMWSNLLGFGNLKVPGKKNPSVLDKLVFIFFGSPHRADISGVLLIAVAVVLFLL